MHRSIQLFSASLLTLLLFSCEKTYGIETQFAQSGPQTTITVSVGQTDSVYCEQGVLFDELKARHQIYEVMDYKGVWSIRFKHGRSARFSEQVFPVIKADEAGKWIVSGHPTGISIRKDENGEVTPPALAVGDDGFWTKDGLSTGFPAEEYMTFLRDENWDSPSVAGLLIQEDWLHIYLSDNTVQKHSVIREAFFLVPEYWMDHLVEKEKAFESAIRESGGDDANFVFFTDVHWGKNMQRSPALIRHILDYTPIDDVIFGGDVITTHSTNLVAPMELGRDFQEAFSFLGTRFHCLYGNHDNNSDSQANSPQYHLSEEQVFSWLQSQMTDVVYGGYYNFYYDNPLTRTRIICLDTGRYYYQQFRDKLPDTVSFAVETLSSVPEGWHVIMASHIWCGSKKQSDGTYTQFIEGYITPILKIFDDYNARLSGDYTYKAQTVSYDFSGAGGTIEFCIGGHTHGNFTTASEGGIPVVIVVSDYAKTPEPKTNKEQALVMVVADYANRKLKLFAVGRGQDRQIDL